MPLIPVLTTWLCGWLAYRLLAGRHARLDVRGWATSWLLGAGVVHGVHYGAMLVMRQQPPAALPLALAVVGMIDLARVFRAARGDYAAVIRGEPLGAGLLGFIFAVMIVLSAVQGFGNDTTLIWLGRASAYAANPDYFAHLQSYPYHPGYPPLYVHQLQWQLVFTDADALLGIKLPALGFYMAMACAVCALLRERIHKPLLWTGLIVTLPGFWFNQPYGMADIPLSAYLVTGVVWLYTALEQADLRALAVAAALLGLATLVKTEGVPLVGCVLAALVYLSVRQPAQRGIILRAVVWCFVVGVICAGSWLVLTWLGGAIESDFALSAFTPNRIGAILETALLVLLDPRMFQGIWLVFGLALVWRTRARAVGKFDALVWLTALLYITGMLTVYLFSTFGGGDVATHVRFSYNRLLQQALPLAMVYVAWTLASRSTSEG